MAMSWKIAVGVIAFTLLLNVAQSEIHRAKALRGKGPTKAGYRGHVVPPEDPQEPPQDPLRIAEQGVKAGHSRETWLYSMVSAVLVGLSGVFPLLVVPLEAGKALRTGAAAARLKLLLSFAVGGLLGDVFLHLLPEAWKHVEQDAHGGHMSIGLWVLAGLFTFLVVEKIFPDNKDDDEDEDEQDCQEPVHSEVNQRKTTATPNGVIHHRTGNKRRKTQNAANGVAQNGKAHMNGKAQHAPNGVMANGTARRASPSTQHTQRPASADGKLTHIKTSGWLNLMANVIDNFTHGLAVAGSYCVSTKSGVLTTIIILIHEVPHEVGDFAILLRSGFNRWAAAKAQVLTATGGVLGAFVALAAESAVSAGDAVAWILPFTSGGFIYIALVSVVPDLLKETDSWESFKQVAMLVLGVFAMAAVALYLDDHSPTSIDWLTS